MGAEINSVYRSEEYELPTQAIREMVANAVVHRSYPDEACVQVCIFDDRIEVLSPGMLYGGLDIATAKMGKSRCRNEAIAEPLFEEFGDGIKATMFRKVHNDVKQVNIDEVQENKESENEELKHSFVSIGLDVKGYAQLMEFLSVPRTIPEKPQSSKQKYVKHTKR